MADDWIKFRIKLWHDPRVRFLSRKCPASTGQVVGALVRLWSLADQFAHEENGAGVLRGYTPDDINDEVGIPNFVQSLPADWCEIRGDALYLPQYQEHNGTTAKSRAGDAKRKRASRKRPKNVRTQPDKCPENVRTLPDQRREEKSIKSIGVPILLPEQAKTRKPDPIWDAVVAEFFPTLGPKIPATTATRIGRIVRELKAFKDCTPAEIQTRRKRMVREFGEMGDTPESLAKHWAKFGRNERPVKEWTPE